MFSYEAPGLILLRAFIIFFVSLIIMRIMGNRAIGQFSPFDFILMVGIGDIIGAVALETSTSVLSGIEALLGIVILQQVLARATLRSPILRKWSEGKPVVIIQDGKLIRKNLIKTNFNLDDIRQELHKYGMDLSGIHNIKIARLESTGEFTLVKNPDIEPITYDSFRKEILNIFENPLSSSGSEFAKLRIFIGDLEYLSSYIAKKSQILVDDKLSC